MKLPDELLTVFSAEVDERRGSPVVSVPDREIDIGELEPGETYRIAVLSRADTGSGSDDREPGGARQHSRRDADRPVSDGEQVDVEIEDIGEKGDGIARVGPGYIVFVPGTDIGDRVTVEVTQARENYGFAEVIEDEPISG